MFAMSRTASVIGRIKILIDSINTIKGIRIMGVPPGTRWASERPGEENQPKATIPTQRDNARLRGRMR
jgi:hypothetical protein